MMENKYQMSYFEAPITNTRPCKTVTVLQVYEMITDCNGELYELTKQVRNAADFDKAKRTRLPFVTSCATFEYRRKDKWVELSGLFPIDIDHLATPQEAKQVRDRLAFDPYLRPVLTYVSPSRRGVKAFVPYRTYYRDWQYAEEETRRQAEVCHETAVRLAMNYTNAVYGTCDGSGKDLARCSFLCYDGQARINLNFTNL